MEEVKAMRYVTAWQQFAAANQAASQAKPTYERLAKRLLWFLIIPAIITTLAMWGWLGTIVRSAVGMSPSRFFGIANAAASLAVFLFALYLTKVGESWVAPRRAANMIRDALRMRRADLISDDEFDQRLRDADEVIEDNDLQPWSGDVTKALPKFATFVANDNGYCALNAPIYVEMMRSKMKYHQGDAARENGRIKKYELARKLLPAVAILLALISPAFASLAITAGLLADRHLANLRLVPSRDRNRWTAKELGKLLDEYIGKKEEKTTEWEKDWMKRVETVWAQEQASWASSYGAMASALAAHATLPGTTVNSK